MGFLGLDKIVDAATSVVTGDFDGALDAGLGFAKDIVGDLADDVLGGVGFAIGGPIGGFLGDALGDIVGELGQGVIDQLGESFLQGGPTSLLTDLLGNLLSGGDLSKAGGIADWLRGALEGLSPQEAVQQLGNIAHMLGIDPQSLMSALEQVGESAGIDTNDPAFQQLLSVLGEGTAIGNVLAGAAGKGNAGAQQAGAAAAGGAGGTVAAGGAHGSSDPTPVGGVIDGADGFLFKPYSESNGNLVILLPKEMTGDVQSVVVKDQNGNVLEQGNLSGATANGGREHYRFGHPGNAFPPNVTVEVTMRDGTTKEYNIPNPALRWD